MTRWLLRKRGIINQNGTIKNDSAQTGALRPFHPNAEQCDHKPEPNTTVERARGKVFLNLNSQHY